jgi:hypothetical protein
MLCPDKKAWRYALYKCEISDEPMPNNSGAMCSYWSGGLTKFPEVVCIVTLGAKSDDYVQICGLLAHEAVHVMQATLKQMSNWQADKVERHDELEAYIIQWATQSLIQAYDDYTAYIKEKKTRPVDTAKDMAHKGDNKTRKRK